MPDPEVLNPLVPDLEGLFRYSGQLDQLRDTAKLLVKKGGAPVECTRRMVDQYRQLRDELKQVMRDDVAAEIDRWAPVVPDDSSVELVFFASAALARWADLVHQTPQFLLAQQVGAVNAAEVGSKIAESMSRSGDREGGSFSVAGSPGQYL